MHFLFEFDAATTSGLFAGVTTNTPALAALLDMISNRTGDPVLAEESVVGYSLSYPMGVLGVMLAITVVKRWFKVDFKKEARELRHEYPMEQDVTSFTVRITQEAITKIPLRDLVARHRWPVIFGRMQRQNVTFLPNWDTQFELNDQVMLVGNEEEADEVQAMLGERMSEKLSYDTSEYDVRRIFVSNPDVAGQQLSTLNLSEKYSAIVTRVKRGDIDLLARGDTIVELGDRVRLVARRKDMKALTKLFGDSYEALGRINLFSFGLGMALGLLLGMTTFELPGNVTFKLGYAGGPIIIGLLLGALRRTGPVVWTLPYSANLTLRQIGLILLLAGIGVNSGHNFVHTLQTGGGGWIFLSSALISITTAFTTLIVGYKLLKIPFSFLMGMVSNQPAILDFSLDKAGNKLPTIGFTLMLPIALITKIVFVQFLFLLLS
jgi:putative transport protein